MGKLIIFDFEVFKKDTLLGTIIIENNKEQVYQTWSLNDIKKFYEENKDSAIWIGWNNSGYDNFILQSIINDKNPFETSKKIIEEKNRYLKLNIKLYYYDLMNVKPVGLKTIEAFEGKNISESNVDFDLDRELTEEEKLLTEKYNRDDLNQTKDNFYYLKNGFELKLALLNKFNLPLNYLNYSEAMLAGKILHAHKANGIENQIVKPIIYENLQITNKDVLNFYLSGNWAYGKTFDITLCGTKNKIARGGIHGALEKCQFDEALYIDVSGYYNLIMINFDLLPRTMSSEGKEIYKYLFTEQLKMKKTNPLMRAVFKIILLAVSGAMMQEHSDFYDPYHGDLMRMTGQMFLVDLLEKLEGKVILIQSNTDGIIVKPINGYTKDDIIEIARAWMDRTGFQAKVENIYNIVQRDVNNYMYTDDKENVEVRGEALKHYYGMSSPFATDGFNSKEPLIIAKCIVEYFMNGKMPERVIEECKDNLRYFQYICKKVSYDYMEYEEIDISTGNIKVIPLQHVNRAFALKSNEIKGMIYKRKFDGKKAKVSNLPDSVFVYNEDINSEEIYHILNFKIDYNYYIQRAYERILEFLE